MFRKYDGWVLTFNKSVSMKVDIKFNSSSQANYRAYCGNSTNPTVYSADANVNVSGTTLYIGTGATAETYFLGGVTFTITVNGEYNLKLDCGPSYQ